MMTSSPAAATRRRSPRYTRIDANAGTSGDDHQRVRGFAAGAHVVQIELFGAARRDRPAHRPHAGQSGQLVVHPAAFGVHRHRDSPPRITAGSPLSARSGRRPSPRSAPTAHGCAHVPYSASPRRRPPADPSTPRTRSCGSTTLASSLPIRQVPSGWYSVCAQVFSASSKVASLSSVQSRGRAIGPSRSLQRGSLGDPGADPQPFHHRGPVHAAGIGQVPRIDDRLGERVGGPQRDLAAAFRLRPGSAPSPRHGLPGRQAPRRRTAPARRSARGRAAPAPAGCAGIRTPHRRWR